MSSAKLIFKPSKVFKNGTSPVLIQIIHKRKQYTKQILKIKAKNFDHENMKVKNSIKGHKAMNLLLERELLKANKYLLDCELKDEKPNPNLFFSGFIDKKPLTEVLKDKAKLCKSVRTAEKFTVLSNKVNEYDKNASVNFDKEWIEGFNYYWMKKGNASTTRERDLRMLRSINRDAFKGFKMPSKKSLKVKLDPEEVKKLEETNYKLRSVQIAVDMWLFSYYHWGIRVHNLLTLKYENIDNGFLKYYTQKKPAKYHEIKLNQKGLKILEKYSGESKFNYIFPVTQFEQSDKNDFLKHIESKTAVLNMNIKKACQEAKINKKISMHTARHTAAFILDQKGVPMQYIQDILGHENRATTENYVKSLKKFDKLNDKIDGLL